MDQIWQRLREARHTAVLGPAPADPPADLRLVRVSCDVPLSTLGPLLEARRKAERVLGSSAKILDQARGRVVEGLRRRLLGEPPAPGLEGEIVEALNRLAGEEPHPVLVFEAVEAADPGTLEVLRRIVTRPGWLRVPLLLTFRNEPQGAARGLLDALRAVEGPAAIAGELPEAEPPAAPPRPAPPDRPRFTLDPEALRVLRAGAVIGSGFEAELVAELLGVDALDALDALQRAADAGIPLDDRGEGRFHLPEALVAELRASVLPSLAVAWHRRLARLLGEARPPRDEVAATRRAPVDFAEPRGPSPATAPPPPAPPTDVEPPGAPAAWPYEDLFHGGPMPSPTPASEEPARTTPAEGEAPLPEPRAQEPEHEEPHPATKPPPPVDPARSAQHLHAAGETEGAAESYLAAAQRAAAMGAPGQAEDFGERALDLLGSLPASPARRRLKARVLLELGRLHWQASGPDGAYTLAGARALLDRVRAELRDDDPPDLAVELALAVAGVEYDHGDLESLGRALDALTDASRRLLAAGDAAGAARLLNDQAAVYVRMGDPVRAAHLLDQSRSLFEQKASADPVAMVEMAETDHLFARIPLHVAARPGREGDALSMGLDHALAAERAYRTLGQERELGRVWETMGRLELRKGRLDRARERLVSALDLAQRLGDVTGLARATGALSELLAESGQPRDALDLLADSISLNQEKGSPIGLLFNRRALEAIARTAGRDPALGGALAEVAESLDAAERLHGRLKLPSERE